MSVFQTLLKEHKLFEQIAERIERSLKFDQETAQREIRNALLVLLPALDRHEEIETLIFGRSAYTSRQDAKEILAEVGLQHRRIDVLRRDILDVLNLYEDYTFRKVRELILQLIEKLRLHFLTEETRLWPHYNKTFSRSLGASMDRKTQERVAQLEAEIKKNWDLISDYLGAKV